MSINWTVRETLEKDGEITSNVFEITEIFVNGVYLMVKCKQDKRY